MEKRKGMEKGKAEEREVMEQAFVNRLHDKGKALDEIADLTALSVERIRKILGL